MNPEALILRRCYPVPVTFADLRAAYAAAFDGDVSCRAEMERQIHRADRRPNAAKNARTTMRWIHAEWHIALKQVTGAVDEVYAVVDGREVRVAIVELDGRPFASIPGIMGILINLLEVADEQGYWKRPHEVRLDLSPRPVMHDEVARAVLTGQKYVEKQLTKVSYDNEMFDATRR